MFEKLSSFLAHSITELCVEKKITLNQLAKKAGMDERSGTALRIKLWAGNLTLEELVKLAEAMDMEVYPILRGVSPGTRPKRRPNQPTHYKKESRHEESHVRSAGEAGDQPGEESLPLLQPVGVVHAAAVPAEVSV